MALDKLIDSARLDGALSATATAILSKTGGSTPLSWDMDEGFADVIDDIPTQSAQTITPTTSNQTISSGTFLTGDQTILGDTNLIASNIMSGVSIFGVTGTLNPGGNLDSVTINTSKFTSQSTTIGDGLVDVEDFSGQTMGNGSTFKYFSITNNFINFSIPNKYKFVGAINIQWTNGDIETYTINSDYINMTSTATDYPISFTWSSSNHSQTFTDVKVRYNNSTGMYIRFYYTTAPTESPVAISPSTLSVYCETEGYESITVNLADDPRFTNINRSLYARSFIYDSAPWISEWCNSFSCINTLQFAGQVFIGSFTFNNVAYISAAAFTSDTSATLFNVSSGYFNFPSCSLIDQRAFMNNYKNIAGITATNCTIISDAAFSGCNSLNTISFPNCTTISASAFQCCRSLTTASFPSCTLIGSYAFQGCASLTSISFPECTSISGYAFADCEKITDAYFPKCGIIQTAAFSSCYSLTLASFPSCPEIYSRVFYSCSNLSTISFPECTKIWHSAFQGCSNLTTANFSKCTTIYNSVFYNCINISSVSFPLCVDIGSYTFGNCYSLTSINLPECVNISAYAFQNCSNLISVSLPKCEKILDRAFSSCAKLQTISLPKLSSLGGYVFTACYSLSAAYFMSNSVVTAGVQVFNGSPIQYSSYLGYFGSIYVPASLLTSYKTATNWAQYSSRMVGI